MTEGVTADPSAEVVPDAGLDAPVDQPTDIADGHRIDHLSQIDRDYIEKLRNENATARVGRKTWQPFEQTFSAFHPDDRQAMLMLAQQLRDDPRAAAETMRRFADFLTPAQQQAAVQAVQQNQQPEQMAPGEKPLTRAELDQLLAERENAQQEQALTEKVFTDAAALGYPKGHPEHVMLLITARDNHDGDLQAAAEAMAQAKTAERDAWIAEYTEGKHRPGPKTAPRQGAIPSDSVGDGKTLKDAEARMNARLDGVLRGSDGRFTS